MRAEDTRRHLPPQFRSVALSVLAFVSAASAQPVLEVRVNDAVQANNAEVTYPSTALGSSTPIIFVIRNIGNQDLLFTGDPIVSLGGGFSEDFSVIQPPLETGNKLSPNSSSAFRVDFSPSQVRDRIDTRIFIFTNAAPTVFQMTLAGRGTGPKIVVRQGQTAIADESEVTFQPAAVNGTTSVEFSIRNEGDATLYLAGTTPVAIGGGAEDDFVVAEQPAAVIAPGQTTTFRVAFAPLALGLRSSRMYIANNEASLFMDREYDIALKGQGLPAALEEAVEEPIEEGVVDAIEDVVNANDNGYYADDENVYQDIENANDNGNFEEQENEADFEEEEFEDDEELNGVGLCGFGIPFGLAGCMLSLASVRRKRWSRVG